ncbi:MAG TPA: heavy-metal-associated domain-containing protein [Elusimicrobiales bacterium]|nr:heavy-metal-associated domain-containing protein [Elusimicrobiales bacterium]
MKATIKVTGMSCGGCKLSVENAVKKLPGVVCAEASLEKAELAVEFDEKKAALAAVRAAVAAAGFKAG